MMVWWSKNENKYHKNWKLQIFFVLFKYQKTNTQVKIDFSLAFLKDWFWFSISDNDGGDNDDDKQTNIKHQTTLK